MSPDSWIRQRCHHKYLSLNSTVGTDQHIHIQKLRIAAFYPKEEGTKAVVFHTSLQRLHEKRWCPVCLVRVYCGKNLEPLWRDERQLSAVNRSVKMKLLLSSLLLASHCALSSWSEYKHNKLTFNIIWLCWKCQTMIGLSNYWFIDT